MWTTRRIFIGYGRPATSTILGRVFSCLYALIGIPLFLVILKEVGKHLSRILRKGWLRWTRTRLNSRTQDLTGNHRFLSIHNPFKMKQTSLYDVRGNTMEVSTGGVENRGSQKREKKQKLPFPISLSFVLLIAWILMCAGMFCIWERHWGFFTAVYFVFISLR